MTTRIIRGMVLSMEQYAASVIAQTQVAYQSAPPMAYVLMALGTTCFGNLVAVPAVLLGLDGALGPRGFWLAPVAVVAGHLFGDVMWFTLGRTLAETRGGEWLRKRMPRHRRVERFFESGSVYILAVSKLLATPTVPILFLLGWYRTEPRRYVRLSVVSAGVWFAGLIAFCLMLYGGLRAVF